MQKIFIFFFALIFASCVVHCDYVDFINFKRSDNANTSCTTDCCKSLPSRSPMTYYFYQNTGRFRGGSGDFTIDTKTYSGQGKGYLNPDYQCVSNTGPLPATTYKLGECVNYMHQTTERPCAFYLAPQKESEMCGRSAFFVHGCQCCTTADDTQPPAAGCSAGCIVMNYANRRKLRVGDTLIVIHYEPKGEGEENGPEVDEELEEQFKNEVDSQKDVEIVSE